MPRSWIPKVRCLSSAEHPILLPFLAPRVFGHPSVKDNGDWNTRHQLQKQKEKGKRTCSRPLSDGPTLDHRLGKPGEERIHPAISPTTNGQCQPQSSSSSRFCTALSEHHKYGNILTGKLGRPALKSRYADISRFVRLYSYFGTATQAEAALQEKTERRQMKWHPGTFVRNNHEPESDYERRVVAREEERTRVLEEAREDFDELMEALNKSGVPESERKYDARFWKLIRQIHNLSRPSPQSIGIKQLTFAALDRKIYPSLRRITYDLKILHDSRCKMWADDCFTGVGSEEELRSRWKAIEDGQDPLDSSVWEAMLFYLLDVWPRRALDFLRVTGCDSDRDPILLATSMEYLARLFGNTRSRSYNTKKAGEMLVEVFCDIYQQNLHRYPALCAQDLLSNIPKLADPATLLYVYGLLLEHNAFLHPFTLLHWVDAFADHRYIQRALQVLKGVATDKTPGRNMSVNAKVFLKSCTHILDKCVERKTDYHLIPEIVAELTNMGVTPGIFANNVVIRHAMAAGDFQTAFRVYNVMEENGLQPDGFTYSTLLSGCARSDDPSIYRDFSQHCKEKVHELDDRVLGTNYLYYIYVLHKADMMKPSEALHDLLEVYSEFFDFAPLQILKPDLDPFEFPAGLNLPPEPVALFIILSALIRVALEAGNNHVLHLYQHFRSVTHPINDPHPAIATLARTTYIYNVFLKAFCDAQQFASASTLISEMTNSSVDGIPKPGVIAWTIFMHAFFRNDQVQAAERVFGIMKDHGVEPDQATWGLLLKEYARMQEFEKLQSVLKHVDLEQDLDPTLLAALAQVHQRKRLQFELDKKRLLEKEKEEAKEKGKPEREGFVWENLENLENLGEQEELEEDERWYRKEKRKDR